MIIKIKREGKYDKHYKWKIMKQKLEIKIKNRELISKG